MYSQTLIYEYVCFTSLTRSGFKVTPGRGHKGLRHFSTKVCEKVEKKGVTTYGEVADELVRELNDPYFCQVSEQQPGPGEMILEVRQTNRCRHRHEKHPPVARFPAFFVQTNW